MQADTNELFTGDSWEYLPQRVKQTGEPMLEILREFGDDSDIEGGITEFVKHLLWLVPLAEVLRQRTELHELYPLIHHAVIELKRLPHSVPQTKCFTFYAESEDVFSLSEHEWQTGTFERHWQVIGTGNAEQAVALLVNMTNDGKNSLLSC
jgi:hypothetical protein